jgi:beta-lactam-binding protein with PASTA domain
VLLQAGYRVRVDRRTAAPDALLAPGAVVAQTPAGGAPQGPGTLVTLVLSDGSDTRVRIPEPGVSSAPSS